MKKFKLIAMLPLVVIISVVMVGCKNNDEIVNGTFYSLQEAYEAGLLTEQDLQCIANHQNNGTNPSDTLSEKNKKSIKETEADNLRNRNPNPISEATAEDITIDKYYGTYNGCVAVMISDAFSGVPGALWDDEVAGVIFNYFNGNSIVIWKQN